MSYEEKLEANYPWIDWREPVEMTIGDRLGYACRFCIAIHGYGPENYPGFGEQRDKVVDHIKSEHLRGGNNE